jgi:NAD(P)-dependent dehydrogenase (short-subunit alcohol dehydrogenase family)
MKILITGASRGIGLFLMQKFLFDGHEVLGTYNKTAPSNENLKSYRKVNIANNDDVVNWIKDNVRSDDKVVLLNCAGTNYNSFAHKTDINKWKNVIDVNLIGTFNVVSNILPHMRDVGFGRIINFSSIVAQKGVPGTSAYAASKAALWGMTKSIAVENATKGITINNLNLGYFDIGMITDVPEEMLIAIKKTIPRKDLGDPIDIINAIKFLIDSDYITGTSLDINGGLY